MKVLWFSLSPCGSLRRSKELRVIQGWMISLEDEIKKHKDIQLSVAYYSDVDETSFEYDGVTYYPMYKGTTSKTRKVWERYQSIEKEDKRCLPLLLGVISKCRPDLIHIHGTEQNFCRIAEHVFDIPICVSIQGMLAPCSEKFFSGFSREDFNRYQSIYTKLKGVSAIKLQEGFARKGQREISFLKNAKYVLGRTFWDHHICTLLNPELKYFTVNEILRAEFFTHKWNKEQFGNTINIVTVLSSGQIYKGIDTLFKTAHLLKEHARFQFKWNIIGCEDNDWLIDMAEKITGNRMEDISIVNLGRKNAEELATILSEADIYCHTSHIENSPNSICEAMLVGTPIVATYAGGTADMTKNCATLIQDGDPYIMAGAISFVVSDIKRAQMLSEKGRKIALERHTPNNVAKELIYAYNTILKEI